MSNTVCQKTSVCWEGYILPIWEEVAKEMTAPGIESG